MGHIEMSSVADLAGCRQYKACCRLLDTRWQPADSPALLLHLQDQYIEVSSLIPASATLFGAGEHISATGLPLRRDGTPLTLWTRDCAAADPDQNTYGSWPFLLDVREGMRIFLRPLLLYARAGITLLRP